MIKNILIWLYKILLKRKLTSIGKGSIIKYPFRIEGDGDIIVGDNVYVYPNCHFQTISVNGTTPEINFGNNIRMWYNSQISCVRNVLIESGCTFAANCFITDVTHRYDDINIPAYNTVIKVLPNVIVGEGTWVGRNVIISGVRIGKHCII